MRTAVICPSSWTLVESHDAADRYVCGGVEIVVEHPVEKRVARDPAAPSLETTAGWEYQVARGERGLAATFRFLDHVGVIRAAARDVAALDALADEIRGVMGTARPLWNERFAVSLAQAVTFERVARRPGEGEAE